MENTIIVPIFTTGSVVVQNMSPENFKVYVCGGGGGGGGGVPAAPTP